MDARKLIAASLEIERKYRLHTKKADKIKKLAAEARKLGKKQKFKIPPVDYTGMIEDLITAIHAKPEVFNKNITRNEFCDRLDKLCDSLISEKISANKFKNKAMDLMLEVVSSSLVPKKKKKRT